MATEMPRFQDPSNPQRPSMWTQATYATIQARLGAQLASWLQTLRARAVLAVVNGLDEEERLG
jgi:hypothetical protein